MSLNLNLGIGLGVGASSAISAGVAPAWDGFFSSLITAPWQSSQGDKGMTFDTLPFAAGTSPPVMTLSGTLTSAGPLLFKPTTPGTVGSGAVFAAYADGGTTPFMTGITPTAGTPVALTGAYSGLSAAWAAGTASSDNTWTGACGRWADNSGRGADWVTLGGFSSPLITVGLNGKPGLSSINGNVSMIANVGLPSNPNSPIYMLTVLRVLTWVLNSRIIDGSGTGNCGALQMITASPTLTESASGSSFLSSTALPVNSWGVAEQLLTGSTATWPNNDTFKVGSGAVVTGSLGTPGYANNRSLFSANAGAQPSKVELLATLTCPVYPSTRQRAALKAAITTWSNGLVAL